jgi:hypothetical protein
MHLASPFPASMLRPPSPQAQCSCEHWVYCDCRCHARSCDPAEIRCDPGFLPDEGGLTVAGCSVCTPGADAPHLLGCDLIGWHVVVEPPGTWRP